MTLFDDLPPDAPVAPPEPHARVRMEVAYDGRGFRGFAPQQGGVRTVGGVLASAMERVLRLPAPPQLTCAGRTDAGVHAREQWVHADLPVSATADLPGLQRRLLKLLGPEVVVRAVDMAPPGWDARRSALSRTYRYTVLATAAPDPLRAGSVWWLPGHLDRRAMDLAADALVGEHDFASFCRKQGDATLVRRVTAAGWSDCGTGTLVFEITANAFCQQMVRAIVGTLVEMGSGRRKPGEMLGIIRARDRGSAGQLAPPQGLVLWAVAYPPEERPVATAAPPGAPPPVT
ncbi:MAG TPA: tRNA pseudouridine(38-40) synthase TruA [Acidimicrobiales bacterium]|nr:tRNA pseudouridine(38-40) synthase TruA [Acidimicrobiales bacterium]